MGIAVSMRGRPQRHCFRERTAALIMLPGQQLTLADGALGFWKAAGKVWPKTCEQRCWVHKMANVLAKFQEIWMTETKAVVELAFDAFIESFTPKYEKAATA